MAETRIYKVINEADQSTKMIEASSAAQAVRHAVAKIYRADVATTKEVASFMTSGNKIMIATEQTNTNVPNGGN